MDTKLTPDQQKIVDAGNVAIQNASKRTGIPYKPINFNPSSPVSAPNLKNDGSTYNPLAPSTQYQTTIGTNALAEAEPMKPPVVNEKEIQRQSLYDKVLKGGADVVAQKAQAREDADIQARQDAYNKELAGYKNRKNAYEDEIEKLEKNPRGMLSGALQSEVDDLRRKANKDLAYMAVNVELAQNNYQGAEKILNDRIADIQQDYDNELKKFQIAQDFLQNDLSESEKLQANQAFERETMQTRFELDQLKADKDAIREQADPLYKAKLANERLQGQVLSQEINDASANTVSTGGNIPNNILAKSTEGEKKGYGFLNRAINANSVIDSLETGKKEGGKGYKASGFWTNAYNKLVGMNIAAPLPGDVQFRPGKALGMQTNNFESYNQASEDFIYAVLRLESGATIPTDEMANYKRTYFPVTGDSKSTIQQKQQSRITATNFLRSVSGRLAPYAEQNQFQTYKTLLENASPEELKALGITK